jgi:hypothetical protein
MGGSWRDTTIRFVLVRALRCANVTFFLTLETGVVIFGGSIALETGVVVFGGSIALETGVVIFGGGADPW